MTIEDLKNDWDLLKDDPSMHFNLSQEMVHQSIHEKAKGEIWQIRRNLRIKFWVGGGSFIMGVVLLVLSLLYPEELNVFEAIFTPQETIIFISSMVVSIGVMLIFNYRAFKKISPTMMQDNLRSSLSNFIQSLRSAIRFNIYSDTFMTPLLFGWFVYAYIDRPELNYGQIIVLGISLTGIGFLSYFLQRFMQKRKFGQYLDTLERIHDSLK